MRLRTAVTATVLAAIAVLGGSGLAAADGFGDGPGDGFNDNGQSISNSTPAVIQFGDLVSD
ncbi:hypothetical protein [Streptomyces sp. NPDC016845]|uniref:hypothetical protein n=1 Tax=Streptomyces sp. NPDC016845 TaxID=3364972 RepID=UPI0037A74B94